MEEKEDEGTGEEVERVEKEVECEEEEDDVGREEEEDTMAEGGRVGGVLLEI